MNYTNGDNSRYLELFSREPKYETAMKTKKQER